MGICKGRQGYDTDGNNLSRIAQNGKFYKWFISN